MGNDKKKIAGETREQKMSPSRKKKVEEIIKEAEYAKPTGIQDSHLDLEAKIKESENKRRILAEALHSSRGQMQNLAGSSTDGEERALPFGYFVRYGNQDDDANKTAIIRHHGRLYEACISLRKDPELEPKVKTFHALRDQKRARASAVKEFLKGELLLLNNELHVIEPRGFDLICGCLGTVQRILHEGKLLIKTYGDETIMVTRAHPMLNANILVGDNIEYDPDSLFVYSVLPKSNVDRLALEKVPDLSYDNIGGLGDAIQQIRDAIELPHIYPEYFHEHHLTPPKGILLYGPPGCGKTLIAKAVANSMAQQIKEKTGEKGESYFLNVKGPELLNKYVGATEQAIRDLFALARSQASYRTPVIIFFDEMDSMFRVRGSGVSSDMESTIVPQFLAELDGLEALENVVVIGATNREDLIDPAVLRPGRLDRKIRITRPDKHAAVEIFSKYLTPELPIATRHLETLGGPGEAVEWMIREAGNDLFEQKPENEFLEITYADGTRKILYLKDLASGAIIENIVNRAKFLAVKSLIESGRKGISIDHISQALRAEFKENEDLPSNTNPAEWHRIIGKGGERVVRIRSLQGDNAVETERKKKPRHTVKVGKELE
ncbi:MAG: proteasome ATPase [Deltaproteobacteria bacterium]|nr:proteasome ATPase [Deltaproteobacteria bacterium]